MRSQLERQPPALIHWQGRAPLGEKRRADRLDQFVGEVLEVVAAFPREDLGGL
jgi:hypothetical protein